MTTGPRFTRGKTRRYLISEDRSHTGDQAGDGDLAVGVNWWVGPDGRARGGKQALRARRRISATVECSRYPRER